MNPEQSALIVIDIQNDYFPGGLYPLWNSEATLDRIELAIAAARSKGIPVVLVQHIADPGRLAPFFNAGTSGAELHPRLRAAAPEAPVVVKADADSFYRTTLESVLEDLGARRLLICGMMTQNCVTHTAISRAAERFDVTVLGDACTTVDAMIHGIALHALTPRLRVANVAEVL